MKHIKSKILNVIIMYLILDGSVYGQELISNGGFEEYTCLPAWIGEYKCSEGWDEIIPVTNGISYGSPDYYHDSSSFNLSTLSNHWCNISTFQGHATMGIGAYAHGPKNYREYLSSKFIIPMEVGGLYKVTFWINNGNDHPNPSYIGYGCNGLGVAFTNKQLQSYRQEWIDYNPQILIDEIIWDNSWTKYQFEYLADSSYQYFTIGFFLKDSLITCHDFLPTQADPFRYRKSYYFIDEISALRMPNVYGNTVICEGDSVLLTAHSSNDVYTWIAEGKPDSILGNASNIVLSPNKSTNYIVNAGTINEAKITIQVVPHHINILGVDSSICSDAEMEVTLPLSVSDIIWENGSIDHHRYLSSPGTYSVSIFNEGCHSVDTIQLFAHYCPCEPFIPSAFTPNNDAMNEVFMPFISCPISNYKISIFDRWGDQIFMSTDITQGWNGMSNNRDVPSGIYVYLLEYESTYGVLNKKQGMVTLLR